MSTRDERTLAEHKDEEKATPSQDVWIAELASIPGAAGLLRNIASYGIELRGSSPVPINERINTRTINLFTLWFTMSLNLLP